ncbi:MAG TPA: C45 family peptidase [Terriglobales bacterium]|nr:C45 family peptidase [Terriglobales bacterium]
MKHKLLFAGLLSLFVFAAILLVTSPISIARAQTGHTQAAGSEARLQKSYRIEKGGWIYVHLEGAPADIGYQHGYLLAPEIDDAFAVKKLSDTHSTQRDWEFFRKTAKEMLWPKTDAEYQQEMQGIADGLKARGIAMDLWDVVALNGMEELPEYYVPWLNKQEKAKSAPDIKSPGNCSAFVATGSWTKDHQVVIAHNNWTSYAPGERWNIIFDIVPEKGHRILMDGFPGVIVSDDDFGINSDGLMVTETTITQFFGFDPNGKPEFARARKALQYGSSIDDYVRIMLDGNNGGYANDWLLADRKTGEVARFELGLKHHKVWRTKDGYFASSNFASDPELIRDETEGFDPNDLSTSPNARRVRWEQLMQQYKGKIDVTLAQKFLGDHFDSFQKKEEANERTLCGHVDVSPRGIPQWGWGPFHPGGAVQGKATDGKMAGQMTLTAHTGHPCGERFQSKPFMEKHGDKFGWMQPILKDMPSDPWTTFKSGDKP